ncbi:MAG: hypothetical protein NTV31_08595, partial [Bacteroidia bacterium]|nr:hypothetical protein [Bacteroidia bacterium]
IGHVNIKIINQSGMLVSDYDTEAIQDMPVKIDIKWYPSGIYSIIFTNRITRIATRGRFIVIK